MSLFLKNVVFNFLKSSIRTDPSRFKSFDKKTRHNSCNKNHDQFIVIKNTDLSLKVEAWSWGLRPVGQDDNALEPRLTKNVVEHPRPAKN